MPPAKPLELPGLAVVTSRPGYEDDFAENGPGLCERQRGSRVGERDPRGDLRGQDDIAERIISALAHLKDA